MSSWFPKIKEAYYTINQILKALNQLSSQVYRNRDKITALEEVNECLNSEIAKFNNFIEQTEEQVEIIPELKELQSNLNERIETIQENIKSFGRGEIDFNQLLDKHFPQFEMFLNERIKQIAKKCTDDLLSEAVKDTKTFKQPKTPYGKSLQWFIVFEYHEGVPIISILPEYSDFRVKKEEDDLSADETNIAGLFSAIQNVSLELFHTAPEFFIFENADYFALYTTIQDKYVAVGVYKDITSWLKNKTLQEMMCNQIEKVLTKNIKTEMDLRIRNGKLEEEIGEVVTKFLTSSLPFEVNIDYFLDCIADFVTITIDDFRDQSIQCSLSFIPLPEEIKQIILQIDNVTSLKIPAKIYQPHYPSSDFYFTQDILERLFTLKPLNPSIIESDSLQIELVANIIQRDVVESRKYYFAKKVSVKLKKGFTPMILKEECKKLLIVDISNDGQIETDHEWQVTIQNIGDSEGELISTHLQMEFAQDQNFENELPKEAITIKDIEPSNFILKPNEKKLFKVITSIGEQNLANITYYAKVSTRTRPNNTTEFQLIPTEEKKSQQFEIITRETSKTELEKVKESKVIEKMGTPSIFCCFSYEDKEIMTNLAEILRFMGINVCLEYELVEYENSDLLIEQMKKCDGAIILLTPKSLESSLVENILKEALLIENEEQFKIFPILYKKNKERVKNWSVEKFDTLIKPFATYEKDEDSKKKHNIDTMQRIFEQMISEIDERKGEDKYFNIQLFSKEQQKINNDTDLAFDLTSAVEEVDKMIIKEKSELVYECIKRVRDSLSKISNIRKLRIINPKVHIILTLAFGFIFRSTTGYNLEILHNENIYRTLRELAEAPALLKEDIIPGDEEKGTITTIEVSVAQSIREAVSDYIDTNNINYRKRIHIHPKEGISRDITFTDEKANQMAKAIATKIRDYSQEKGTDKILFYGAMPIFLSFMIGYELNTARAVKLYEYHNKDRKYYPLFRIE